MSPVAPRADACRVPAITSRRGTLDRGAYPASLIVRRVEALVTLFVDHEDKTELRVHDVEALNADLRRRHQESTPGGERTVEHRVTVIASKSPSVAARGREGVVRVRRDDENDLMLLAVTIEGGGSFEFGFQDVEAVLTQLRRFPSPGPRLLRDIMRDLFDDLADGQTR